MFFGKGNTGVPHLLTCSAWVVGMCGFRKYSFPPHGRSLEIPRGRGSQQPTFIRESMNLNWKFQRGGGGEGGLKRKESSIGEVWILSGTTQWLPNILCEGFV